MISIDDIIIEHNKELIADFPFLAPKNVFTGELDDKYDYSWTILDEVPDGWIDLFLLMCEDLREQLIKDKFLDKFVIYQVKEKFGKLRLSTSGYSEKVGRIIRDYEYISQFVCYKCGKSAKLYDIHHYTLPYCKSCLKEYKKKLKTKYIKKPKKYIHKVGVSYRRYRISKRYLDDYIQEEKSDTKDIWKRLHSYV